MLTKHGTLEKLTLPHDANSVVQNKKGKNRTKPRKKTTHAQRGIHAGRQQLKRNQLLFVHLRGGVFSRLSLEYS